MLKFHPNTWPVEPVEPVEAVEAPSDSPGQWRILTPRSPSRWSWSSTYCFTALAKLLATHRKSVFCIYRPKILWFCQSVLYVLWKIGESKIFSLHCIWQVEHVESVRSSHPKSLKSTDQGEIPQLCLSSNVLHAMHYLQPWSLPFVSEQCGWVNPWRKGSIPSIAWFGNATWPFTAHPRSQKTTAFLSRWCYWQSFSRT